MTSTHILEVYLTFHAVSGVAGAFQITRWFNSSERRWHGLKPWSIWKFLPISLFSGPLVFIANYATILGEKEDKYATE